MVNHKIRKNNHFNEMSVSHNKINIDKFNIIMNN